MTELVSYRPPVVEIKAIGGPVDVEVWGCQVRALVVTFSRDGGHPEETIALSSVDLGEMLDYAQGAKAITKLMGRRAEHFRPWSVVPSQASVYKGSQSGSPWEQRTYVFGPGLDLLAVASSQPRSFEFQSWLAERGYELRSRGVAFASPEHERAAGLALQQAGAGDAVKSIGEAIAAALRESSAADKEVAAELVELKERQRSLEAQLDEFHFNGAAQFAGGLGPDERSPTQLARRVGWFSQNSGGRHPHPRAVVVAALNEGWDVGGPLIREHEMVIDTAAGPRRSRGHYFTAGGVAAFVSLALRWRDRERFTIRPNYQARRHGQNTDQHVQRRA